MTPRSQSRVCQKYGKRVKKGYKHHYPLTEELGEKGTIFVCPRCHQLDHQLFNRLKQEVERGNIQIDLDGNDPYTDRRAAIKAVLERMRNQKRLLP